MQITALAGGVGASKLLLGLYQEMDPRDLTIIVNTGDDIVLHSLAISPDLDIVSYTLAGLINPETGWGVRADTFNTLHQLALYDQPSWFQLGDRDLATHIYRTAMLRQGMSLSEVTDTIRVALGVKAKILPMSDHPVTTIIATGNGRLNFQEYLVRERAEPIIRGISFAGVEKSVPAPGVIESMEKADQIIICPSNPLISIGPILAVPWVRETLRKCRSQVIAVSPIVGGRSLKGPSDRMLSQLGFEVSASAVARLYEDFCSTFIVDSSDNQQSGAIESLGMRVVVCPTVMRTVEDKRVLAREILKLAAKRPVVIDQ